MSFAAMQKALKIKTRKPRSKPVLTVLAYHADENNQCFPGHSKLSKETGQSAATVKRAIQDLLEEGLISIEYRHDADGNPISNLYTLRLTASGQAEPTTAQDEPSPVHSDPTPRVTVTPPSGQHELLIVNESSSGTERKETCAKHKPKQSKTELSQDWIASDADRAYARDQGLDNAQIGFQEKSFKEHWLNPDTKNREKSDWPATWRNWILRSIGYATKGVANLPRDLATARVNKLAAKPIIYVIKDTPQWKAWKSFYQATRGVDPPETDIRPNGRYGRVEKGWDGFETEWPPGYQPQQQAAI